MFSRLIKSLDSLGMTIIDFFDSLTDYFYPALYFANYSISLNLSTTLVFFTLVKDRAGINPEIIINIGMDRIIGSMVK